MAEATFTAEQRERILELCEEHGDAEVCRSVGVNASTLRSWRRRSIDRRVRDDDGAGRESTLGRTTGAAAASVTVETAEIRLPAPHETDPASGSGHKHHQAMARVVKEGGSLGTRHPTREGLREFLTAPDVQAQLAEGEVIVVAGNRWTPEAAARHGYRYIVGARDQGRVWVRAGELRRGEKLSADRRRIVEKRPEDEPGYRSPEERLRGFNSQPSLGEMQARAMLGDRLFDALKRLADEYDTQDARNRSEQLADEFKQIIGELEQGAQAPA